MEYGLDHIIINLISVVCLVTMLVLFLRMENKQQLQYLFLYTNVCLLIWIFFRFVEEIVFASTKYNSVVLISIFNIGANFIPLTLLLSCIVYTKGKIKFNKYYLLLIIPPVASLILVFTNSIHGQYYIKYTSYYNQNVYGLAYYFHILYSYIYTSYGVYVIIRSLKSVEFISKQTIILLTSVCIPACAYFLITFKIMNLPLYFESVCFAFSAVLILFAVTKHKFLNIVPIAINTIFNNITDSIVLINSNYLIIEYNDNFKERFKCHASKYDSFFKCLEYKPLILIKDLLLNNIYESISKHSIKQFEVKVYDNYFIVEISPIFTEHTATVIVLFRDITEQKRLIEMERISSLVQMIGGIAHNLKTPLMTSGAGIKIIQRNIKMIKQNLYKDQQVDQIDEWANKVESNLMYMSDIIAAVKGQVVIIDEQKYFTVSELLDKVSILMNYEFKKGKCLLRKEVQNGDVIIYGDMNSLIQVLNNILTNAIEATEGDKREIILGTQIVYHSGVEKIAGGNRSIIFYVRNYGRPISSEIKDTIFKEMVTTKGKDGTGLGLYISKSVITGKFKGSIYFETNDKETIFYVKIPID